VLALEVDYDGARRTGRITVDARGFKGVAQISEAGDDCAPREGIFRCDMTLDPKSAGWSRKELVMCPATGAANFLRTQADALWPATSSRPSP
jgi:hypothetical protein